MNLAPVLGIGFLFSIAAPLAVAQDTIRLQFQVVKNGSIVANPEMSVFSGLAGSIEVEGVGRVTVTPTVRGSDAVAVVFDIRSGGNRLQPQLVIGTSDSGVLTWTGEARQSFKLTISWIR